jgi:sugar phosphate isomerase/epimerase
MKLALPSFVIPGTYLENVEYIAGIKEVLAIELLFFQFDRDSIELFRREKEEIEKYRERFTFTLHMPDSPIPEHEELIELTADLVKHFVIHPPVLKDLGNGSFSNGPIKNLFRVLEKWRNRYGNRFLLENLVGMIFFKEAAASDIPLCLDTGHLLLRGQHPAEIFMEYKDRIKEIHLHGIAGRKDHQVFNKEERWFQELLPSLKGFRVILNIEIFQEEKCRSVLPFVSELIRM